MQQELLLLVHFCRAYNHIVFSETGWNMVLSSLIRAVPLDDVLGPSAITLFIDHCPLPSKVLAFRLITIIILIDPMSMKIAQKIASTIVVGCLSLL